MESLPVEIYAVEAVRAIDRAAIDGEGIAGYTLMTRAGEAAVGDALAKFPAARRWRVLCGAGNNAGDGYVVARLAQDRGIDASVVALVDPSKLSGDAATACSDFVDAGGRIDDWHGNIDDDADLLVDALLGSGLDRPVEGRFADAVNAINAHPAPVLALDIPTGLNGDTGEVMGCAVDADLTVTFVGLKTGLFLGAAMDHTGEVAFAGLDVPEKCRDPSQARLRRITRSDVARALPPRARAAHKGDFGHVLVVGGGHGMPGAVRLCAEAALRSGAGLVSIATHPSHAAMLVATRPELMSHGIESAADLEPLLERASVVAFGPGLGRSDWAFGLYRRLLECDLPAVWDADALNLLADDRGEMDRRIMTPHPGEAARLLGRETAAVQADRVAALNALVLRYGGAAVLKGAGTLVSAADGAPYISLCGNPGMASPGMGDALTGIIAAMLAQGLDLADAARIGVEVHARAGDRAAASGQRGLAAGDLVAELRAVVNP